MAHTKKTFVYTESEAYHVQKLAREQMKVKLLNDIMIDLTICKIEGWDCKEYVSDLLQLLQSIKFKNLSDSLEVKI